jgi:outer membrane protein assembly factor BamD (BamD/ComL family)
LYELGYYDEALTSLKSFLNDYPNSEYNTEGKDLLVEFSQTQTITEALALLDGMSSPGHPMQKGYPRI